MSSPTSVAAFRLYPRTSFVPCRGRRVPRQPGASLSTPLAPTAQRCPAAENHHARSGFFLHRSNFFNDVARDQPRVVLRCFLHCAREDNLFGFVHTVRNSRHRLPGLLGRPISRHHFVRDLAEQQHAATRWILGIRPDYNGLGVAVATGC